MQFSNFVFFAYIIIPENLMSCRTCDSNLTNYHENGDDGDDGDIEMVKSTQLERKKPLLLYNPGG